MVTFHKCNGKILRKISQNLAEKSYFLASDRGQNFRLVRMASTFSQFLPKLAKIDHFEFQTMVFKTLNFIFRVFFSQ